MIRGATDDGISKSSRLSPTTTYTLILGCNDNNNYNKGEEEEERGIVLGVGRTAYAFGRCEYISAGYEDDESEDDNYGQSGNSTLSGDRCALSGSHSDSGERTEFRSVTMIVCEDLYAIGRALVTDMLQLNTDVS